MWAKLKAIWFLKILTVLGTILLLLILLLWSVAPGLLKDYIEVHDTEWIHREVSIEKIGINPFTCTLVATKTHIKEPNSEADFITFDSLLIDFDFWPLLKSKISAQEITATNISGKIVQNGKDLNFSDLLDRDESEESTETISYDLRNISIVKSSIRYTDVRLGNQLIIDSINIHDEHFTSLDSIFDTEVTLHQPQGGWVKGNFLYDLQTSDYTIDNQIEEWQLAPFKKYVTAVIRLSEFKGRLDANLQIAGNVLTDRIKTSGQVTVSNFKLADPENKPLVGVGRFFLDIEQIDTKTNLYDFKNILVNDTDISFEYLPSGDNFTKWLVSYDTSIPEENTATDYYVSPFELLSVYIYDMTKEYIFKSYTADNILFSNFNLKFYDYTLEDPFYMDLEQLEIKAADIKPNNQFADFHINGKMNQTARIKGDISVSRQGVENMSIDMDVKGLFLNRFSPYSRQYTGHRFMEGISSFSNTSTIKDSYLTSTNALHIENIKVSKKNKTRTGSSLPMRLAVAIIKDSKGNVDLEIPIEGPINDPKYKFGKVVWQVIKNLFTKIATSPVRGLSNAFKVNENDLKNIYFDNGQIGLSPLQKKSLDALAKVLTKKLEFNIVLSHLYNKEYEMDAIALKSAKLAYLKQSDAPLDPKIPIGKQAFDLPTSDPEFLVYLEKANSNFDPTISIPENARRLLGQESITAELDGVIAKQKQLIQTYLVTEKGISENRFLIKDASNTEAALNQSRPKFEVKFNLDE